ncbi:MAG: hypothetical protein NT151_13060 [Acidobacteria bacterium]|nr:hypothetical protein [Acidobacteriota bacterium]
MASTDKRGNRPAAKPATVDPVAPLAAVPSSPVLDPPPAPAALADFLKDRVPYLRFAFSNPYNLSLLGGALAASVLTLNPLIALVALGGEALWLLHAPGSERLRHLLWDPRFAELKAVYDAEQRSARMQVLGATDRQRVEKLIEFKQDIGRLAGQNPSFTNELLRGELVKTDRLVESFLDMAVTCARYEHYLASVDMSVLDRDRERWNGIVTNTHPEASQVDIARKNLAVIMKRFEKVQEIQRYLGVARGQLDLIENSFRLLADQIVTMQSPQELSGQLDELLNGVEAIKASTADTERMLSSMGLTNNV